MRRISGGGSGSSSGSPPRYTRALPRRKKRPPGRWRWRRTGEPNPAVPGPEEVSAMRGGGPPAISPRHGQDLPPAPAGTPPVAERRGRRAEDGPAPLEPAWVSAMVGGGTPAISPDPASDLLTATQGGRAGPFARILRRGSQAERHKRGEKTRLRDDELASIVIRTGDVTQLCRRNADSTSPRIAGSTELQSGIPCDVPRP